MKRKYFKQLTQKRDNAMDEIKKEVTPLLKKRYAKWKAIANRYPRRTLVIMLAVASVNFFLFLYLNRNAGSAYSIKDVYSGKIIEDNFPGKHSETGIPFTLGNFMQMKAIKDSLEYYLSNQHKTRADTLLLLRLFKKYETLDTSFKTDKIIPHESN